MLWRRGYARDSRSLESHRHVKRVRVEVKALQSWLFAMLDEVRWVEEKLSALG
jgi:hypothetical protein